MAGEGSHIIIDGFGLLTPLGFSAWETFRALLGGRTMADRAAALPPRLEPAMLVKALGGVAVVQHVADDPAIELAERAAREAMAGREALRPAIHLGTSKGAMHALTRREPLAIEPHGYLAGRLMQRLQLPVVRHSVAACASSLTALHHARLAMLHGGDDAALVVTSEAALLPMFVASYRRLGVLPPLTPGEYVGKPLDETRCGFMLAELGAAVLLRRVDRVEPGQIELTGTAVAADAYDMIRPSPDMSALRHVAGALIAGKRIDLLHPHATGTAEHDPSELSVYADCDARVGDVYACKGAVGHGLGAAGLVSLVIGCLCAKAKRRPAMPWLSEPIATALPLSREARQGEMRTHAVFAAGFGGHVAGAVIEAKG